MEELKNKIIKLLDNYDIFDDYEFYNEKGYFPSPSDYIDEVMKDLKGFKEYLIEILKSEDSERVEEIINTDLVKDIKEIIKLINEVIK